MKTSRLFRIFMMALDTIIMFFLRPFKSKAKLRRFDNPTSVEDLEPHCTENTNPEKHGIDSKLEVDGSITDDYHRADPIDVGNGQPYSADNEIVTFRGDYHRSGAFSGVADIKEKKLSVKWTAETGRLEKGYGHGFWTGSGWTGQPLVINRTDKTEIVYSTMDGNVYFLDIENGENTRPTIKVGLPFKGAGAMHPTLPIVHLGPGDSGPTEELYARAYLYNIDNGEKLLEYGGKDPFSIRKFCGYDSSPIFLNDYVLEPSENGIIYTFKLNSYRDENGELKINPSEFAKLRYKTARSSEEQYWLGMEDSPVIWKNYLYIADNGGTLLCVDLNTMKIVWTQDVVDDTNGSAVLSIENNHPYLYIGTSLHWSPSKFLRLGYCPFFKIDAVTGEYVWIRSYYCNTIAGISGGVQATPAMGRGDIENIIIFPMARTPSVSDGYLLAVDKYSGEEIWRFKMKNYAWSSPVIVYDMDNNPYVIQGDSKGYMHLLNAKTGELYDTIYLGANIEASPIVYNNTIVVGTRGMKIYGIEIK